MVLKFFSDIFSGMTGDHADAPPKRATELPYRDAGRGWIVEIEDMEEIKGIKLSLREIAQG